MLDLSFFERKIWHEERRPQVEKCGPTPLLLLQETRRKEKRSCSSISRGLNTGRVAQHDTALCLAISTPPLQLLPSLSCIRTSPSA